MVELEMVELGRRCHLRPAFLKGQSYGCEMAAEWLRVRGRDGAMVPLRANAAQRSFDARHEKRSLVLKARQMGMSTWIAGQFFLRTMMVPGTLTVMVAPTMESAAGLFAGVQRMHAHLADEVRAHSLLKRSNAEQMVFAGSEAEFRVVSASDARAGRGLTIQNLHGTEVAHWPGDARETLAGLMAAVVRGGQVVLESTPKGADGCFYEQWMRAKESGFERHFFPWWMESEYSSVAVEHGTLREDELRLVEREGLTLEQIGFRRELEVRYGRLRAQEFAEDATSCFLQSGKCFFDVSHEDLVARDCVERRGALQVWLPAVDARRYVTAVDPAGGGVEGDFAAVEVVDAETGMQCAELCDRLSPAALAIAVESIAREYNGATIVVERNNHGHAVIAHLEHRGVAVWKSGGVAGWLTTSVSRAESIALLAALLRERPGLFASERLLQECRSFVTKKSGRVEAANGSHDDCVMAMAMAQMVVKHGLK